LRAGKFRGEKSCWSQNDFRRFRKGDIMPGSPIALVTGANRGIGLEVCRQLAQRGYIVLLGARDRAKGEEAAANLKRQGLEALPRPLDVTDKDSIEQLHAQVESEFGRLDVLVNNAAILYDTWQRALNADLEIVREALETNTLGAWRMCQTFVPLIRRSRHGRIVNVSSEAGSLASMGSGTPAYNLSKAALNALTRMLAADLRQDHILVNAVCPGWVATDMGGPGGRPVAKGAASVLWAATLPDGGPTGGFFRDGKPVPW
jgi:NAD(P)-dependent dehydrogenase (short-subunit alcohol dehydrogenase family)